MAVERFPVEGGVMLLSALTGCDPSPVYCADAAYYTPIELGDVVLRGTATGRRLDP